MVSSIAFEKVLYTGPLSISPSEYQLALLVFFLVPTGLYWSLIADEELPV